jgi:hypothetical protein
MKDFLDELDIEVRDITAKTQANTPKMENQEVKTVTPQKIDEKKPVHKKPVHNHAVTGENKVGGIKPQHPKNNNRSGKTQGSSSSAERKQHKYGRKTLEFPDTKFFLPSLREGYTRYIPIG